MLTFVEIYLAPLAGKLRRFVPRLGTIVGKLRRLVPRLGTKKSNVRFFAGELTFSAGEASHGSADVTVRNRAGETTALPGAGGTTALPGARSRCKVTR